MEPRKFAVVRWLEGEDYGKLSDLRTEAILKYEDDKMDQEGNPKNPYSAYIEWCHGRKHKGGWPHFKASILFVAGMLIILFNFPDQYSIQWHGYDTYDFLYEQQIDALFEWNIVEIRTTLLTPKDIKVSSSIHTGQFKHSTYSFIKLGSSNL